MEELERLRKMKVKIKIRVCDLHAILSNVTEHDKVKIEKAWGLIKMLITKDEYKKLVF